MTAPNLIAIVGAGGALALAGFALLGAAAGIGLYVLLPGLPFAVWLSIIGVILLVVGLTLVERGGSKTVEKVESQLTMPNVVGNFPWTFIGLGAGGGMILFWLLRKVTSSDSPKPEIKPIYVPTPAPGGSFFSSPTPPPPKRMTLSDVLVPIGSAAASYATSVAMKSLGVPSAKDLLGSAVQMFMGSGKKPDLRANEESTHNGYEAAMRRS